MARFSSPSEICVWDDGSVVVADYGNSALRCITTIAQNSSGVEDGHDAGLVQSETFTIAGGHGAGVQDGEARGLGWCLWNSV